MNVTLKLTLDGISVEVTGEAKYAESKLHELVEKYSGRPPSKSNIHSAPKNGEKRKGLAAPEFLKKVSPKSQNTKALALGYYLEKYGESENFTTAELTTACLKAKQGAFTNVSDSIAKLISQGFLMGAGEKDGKRAYALTTSGEKEIEALIADEA